MFATEQQLETLARAKSLYIDSTFRLTFSQGLINDAFVKKDEYAKQVTFFVCFHVWTKEKRLPWTAEPSASRAPVSPFSGSSNVGFRKGDSVDSSEDIRSARQTSGMCISLDTGSMEKGLSTLKHPEEAKQPYHLCFAQATSSKHRF